MSEKKSDVKDTSSPASVKSVKERSKHRGQWANSTEFILASLGNMVGFGNIWRFPYLVFKNGGGIFVIIYIVALLVIGFPIIIVETSLAQYSQSGSGQLFENLAPIFKGVGYCSIAACTLISTYYNVIIAWTIFYFFESFTPKWSHCNQYYNTDNCITVEMAANITRNASTASVYENRTASADEFFNRYMLNKSDSLSQLSWPQSGLTLCLFASTAISVICLLKGVETSGKVVYFTAIYPYAMLLILFIRGITLKGAFTGIKYYIQPNLDVNVSEVFVDAVVQVFFSIGAGLGTLYTFGSFNQFHTKLLQKIVIITIGDMATSIFAGFVVFSMVGFVAELLGKSVPETVTEGTGLVFVVILEGMTQMPLSAIFTFCFVSMLFFLGIDTLFGLMETVATFIHDIAYSKGKKLDKTHITIFVGTVLFLGGLPMTTRPGIYIFNLMDTFCAGLPLLAVAIADSLIVAFVYGLDNFLNDFQYMTGTKIHPAAKFLFKCALLFLIPWLIIALFMNDFISKFIWSLQGKISSNSPPYPVWSLLLGWLMGMGPVLLIPGFAIHYLLTSEKETCKKKYKEGTKATEMYHAAAKAYGSYDDMEKNQMLEAQKK